MKLHLVLPLLAAGACVSTAARLAELRAGLEGLGALELRSCMGVPAQVDEGEGFTVWSYLEPLLLGGRRQDVEIQAAVEPGRPTGRMGPKVTQGELPVHRISSRAGPVERHAIPPGGCLLRFELVDARVVDFEARGSTAANLNADHECALQARRCLAP